MARRKCPRCGATGHLPVDKTYVAWWDQEPLPPWSLVEYKTCTLCRGRRKVPKEVAMEEFARQEVRGPYEEQVSHPGKFEAESPVVPYFWDSIMEGGATREYEDPDDGTFISVVEPTERDRDIWNDELSDVREVHLWEDNEGFVNAEFV